MAEKSKPAPKATKKAAPKPKAGASGQPVLLSGGNPQIPKGYGEAPIQAYIAAMPGWKNALGARIDALISAAVPGVRKAVKWNSPLYGLQDDYWFLGLHCFTHYVKVSFFRGASLDPLPPGPSKQKAVRYLDIHDDDAFDEAQFTAWVQQAAALPGEKM